MLDQLMNLIQESSQEAVVNNPAVPNEHNGAVMQLAGNSVMSTLQQMMAGGQANEVLGLFGSNATDIENSPVTNQIQQNFTESAAGKFGIPPGALKALAAVVVPLILSKMIRKGNDPNDNSFGIQDIFNTLSGGRTAGLNLPNILSRFTGQQQPQVATAGAQAQHSGGLGDLISAFTHGNQSQQTNQPQQTSGGGFMDALKGLLG